DQEHKLVVATHTINRNDKNALYAISKEAKDNIEAKELTVLADKGYHTGKELQACQEAAIDTIVARQELVNSNTKGTSILGKLRDLDGWLRNRLRYCIWHHWKKPERKRKNLIRLGVDQDHAYAWSRTRKGGWAIAQSPIL